jgi:hypothetical protein
VVCVEELLVSRREKGSINDEFGVCCGYISYYSIIGLGSTNEFFGGVSCFNSIIC